MLSFDRVNKKIHRLIGQLTDLRTSYFDGNVIMCWVRSSLLRSYVLACHATLGSVTTEKTAAKDTSLVLTRFLYNVRFLFP